ncbi:hypothetical protein PLICRDRAFT_181196 [Plicaturopsis crispa FD-325 SS-3]|uniref:Uncharacterized protein n=1 Tax=Plicaturopsis crispa FD-325 SS-3 TaxID=944288 RepID=A0A0C9SUX0_PLICR|nr:hypothetical protein PLICRDRAFT_181196 [Plicaturopsis crispa FD-325 SS-3]
MQGVSFAPRFLIATSPTPSPSSAMTTTPPQPTPARALTNGTDGPHPIPESTPRVPSFPVHAAPARYDGTPSTSAATTNHPHAPYAPNTAAPAFRAVPAPVRHGRADWAHAHQAPPHSSPPHHTARMGIARLRRCQPATAHCTPTSAMPPPGSADNDDAPIKSAARRRREAARGQGGRRRVRITGSAAGRGARRYHERERAMAAGGYTAASPLALSSAPLWPTLFADGAGAVAAAVAHSLS